MTEADRPGGETLRLADEPDEDGSFLLFRISEGGCTDKLGYIYAEWADEVRHAVVRAEQAEAEVERLREAARRVLTSPGVSPYLDAALNHLAATVGMSPHNSLLLADLERDAAAVRAQAQGRINDLERTVQQVLNGPYISATARRMLSEALER
jgi:hypothetical protein